MVENQQTSDKTMAEALGEVKSKIPNNLKTKIIGYGFRSSGKGLIHAITKTIGEKENQILCDNRAKQPVIDQKISINMVTCKKCKNYRTFKEKASASIAEKKEKKIEKKEVEVEKKEVEVEKKQQPIIKKDTGPDVSLKMVQNMLKIRIKNLEKRLTAELEAFVKKLLDEKPNFIIANKGHNRFSIVHLPSRVMVVDGISREEAEDLLQKYLAIDIKWDGKTKPPNEWITAITSIHEKWKQKVEKPKRKTKLAFRRSKKPEHKKVKLKIRRRSKI